MRICFNLNRNSTLKRLNGIATFTDVHVASLPTWSVRNALVDCVVSETVSTISACEKTRWYSNILEPILNRNLPSILTL